MSQKQKIKINWKDFLSLDLCCELNDLYDLIVGHVRKLTPVHDDAVPVEYTARMILNAIVSQYVLGCSGDEMMSILQRVVFHKDGKCTSIRGITNVDPRSANTLEHLDLRVDSCDYDKSLEGRGDKREDVP